jgi:hypothetical protein
MVNCSRIIRTSARWRSLEGITEAVLCCSSRERRISVYAGPSQLIDTAQPAGPRRLQLSAAAVSRRPSNKVCAIRFQLAKRRPQRTGRFWQTDSSIVRHEDSNPIGPGDLRFVAVKTHRLPQPCSRMVCPNQASSARPMLRPTGRKRPDYFVDRHCSATDFAVCPRGRLFSPCVL